MSIQDLQKEPNKYSNDLNFEVKTLNATDNIFINGVPVGGAGNPNVLYNINPSGTVTPKSICVFDSSNPYQMVSSSLIYINGNRPQFNNGLQIYDRLFFLTTMAGRANGVILKEGDTGRMTFTNVDGFKFYGNIEADNINLQSVIFSNPSCYIDGSDFLNLYSNNKVVARSNGFTIHGDNNFFEMVKTDLNRNFNIDIVNEVDDNVDFKSSDSVVKYRFDKIIESPNLIDLQGQTDVNTNDIQTLITDTQTISSDLQTLTMQTSTNTTDIETLQNNVTTQSTDITDLQAQADTNTQDISALQNTINSLNNQITNLNNQIFTLNNTVSQNSAAILKLQEIITNLTSIEF